MQNKAESMELLEKAAACLTEHFDNVQIFASSRDSSSGRTIDICSGAGNIHAIYGHVKSWIIAYEERLRIEERESEDDPS
jgi:hypothetical protein